ncbi:MAG: hypothetical protein K9G46_06790 [Flavobacteriales bacterium]|jgi:hypothetical protein|nr:hypothetical protein [Flavobacteriales bacterium]
MASIKQKVLDRINQIEDEELLNHVYKLIYDMQETKKILHLNEEQLNMVQEGIADYKRGAYYSTEELFSELLDDED